MTDIGLLPGDVLISNYRNPGLMFYSLGVDEIGYPFDPNSDGLLLGASSISISPDGLTLLVVLPETNGIYLVPTDGSTPPYSPPVQTGTPFKAVWAPNGTEFTVTSRTSPYLFRYGFPSLEQLQTPPRPLAEPGGRLSYSPDGRYIAAGYNATSSTSSERFMVLDIEINDYVDLSQAPQLAALSRGLSFSPDGTQLFCVASASASAASPIVYNPSDWDNPHYILSGVDYRSYGNQDAPVAYSPSGDKIAYYRGGTNRSQTLRVLNTSDFTVIPAQDPPRSQAIRELAWATNDLLLVLQGSSNPSSMSIYDFTSGEGVIVKEVRDFRAPTSDGGTICTVPGGARRKFSGIVTDGNGEFLQRVVRAIDKATGRRIGQTESDPISGEFELTVLSPNPAIVYCVGQGAEITKLVDGVIPVPDL